MRPRTSRFGIITDAAIVQSATHLTELTEIKCSETHKTLQTPLLIINFESPSPTTNTCSAFFSCPHFSNLDFV